MATMNISLPDQMKEWVEAQVATGRYANASDYMRDLVRRDEKRSAAIAELQAEIDKGIASGVSDRSWDDVMRIARQRAEVAERVRDGVSAVTGG